MFGQNLKEIWEKTSEIIHSTTPDFVYNLWFKECELVSITAKEATITTSTNIARDTILEHFSDTVSEAFKQTLGFSPRIIVLSTENREADLSGVTLEKIEEVFEIKKMSDILSHQTNYGIQRDEIVFLINEKNASKYASQGQIRNIILSTKLTLCKIIYKYKKRYPVLLLDDVLSELDIHKRRSLLNLLKENNQVFITTANKSDVLDIGVSNVQYYEVINGKVKEE